LNKFGNVAITVAGGGDAMKVILQIPCYNEEEHLGQTLAALPRSLVGIDCVEWLVINDGSRDRTLEVAKKAGVDHIVDFPTNMGLADAFKAGLARAVEEHADIIVNTDADNQYDARDIPLLIEPILKREAQFVIGARPIAELEHFSGAKKLLQKLGSSVVRLISGTEVRDAPSGFRALTREAALRINIFDGFTYTLESIIQAGLQNIRVVSVPVRVNGKTRPSRLIRSISSYIVRSAISTIRTLVIYRPGKTLFAVGAMPVLIGCLLSVRWLILFYADGGERAHIPSLVFAAVLATFGFLLWVCGVIGEMLKINRMLLEDTQYHLRRQRLLDPRIHYYPGDSKIAESDDSRADPGRTLAA
jgi:glycosyltransferase involved in cell wall biosynthesis